MRVERVRALRVLLFITVSSFASLGIAQPVVIDGAFDPAEWSGATVYSFDVNVPGGGTTPGELHIKNDSDNVYVAVRYERSALDSTVAELYVYGPVGDGFGVGLNSACPYVKYFYDEFLTSSKECASCWVGDIEDAGTTDGNGTVGNDGSWTTFEMWHPLASGDPAHDMQVSLGEKFGFGLTVGISGTDTFHPTSGLESYVVH